nr:hypothetical protein [Herbidospora sakaeratensis]
MGSIPTPATFSFNTEYAHADWRDAAAQKAFAIDRRALPTRLISAKINS